MRNLFDEDFRFQDLSFINNKPVTPLFLPDRSILARLTLNLARAHTDANASAYGERLVYGGHTVSMASAQITRALPNLVTLVAWRSCDHTAPVFEGDRLSTEFRIEAVQRLARAGGLVDLHVEVNAERPTGTRKVLDWRVVVLMA